MAGEGNILIVDESALFALQHGDWADRIETSLAKTNPLQSCATTLEGLSDFNVHNPLYGPPPVSLLVNDESSKRFTDNLICRYTDNTYPPGAFFALREDLFIATPELAYLRMARFATEVQLAEIGMNLCGRYFSDAKTGKICSRSRFLTTPEKLAAFAKAASSVRGSKKALHVLRFVLPNSGSPYETKMKLLFCHPIRLGGFGLPFTDMNYDVRSGRLQAMMAQDDFSIDMVDRVRRFSAEYDGGESHLDASADKRRRNELATLGWRVFPIDKAVLHDPEATLRAGRQMAKQMQVRLRFPAHWEERYLRLRAELGLPN